MSKSKVYFTDMRTTIQENLPQKLQRLIDTAGLGTLDFHNKYVAIKIHFGEPGNLAYLRPQYARVLVDYIRERGGRPFLTDCNTLYVGGRSNGLDHLDSAFDNGFQPSITHCNAIIADGIKGLDEAVIPLECDYVKEAKIGRALADADIVISLTHAKGHEQAGFGGALKNLGMGGGSRAGKYEMHSSGKPEVDHDACIGCGMCAKFCAQNAITLQNKKASVSQALCAGCGRCIGVCPRNAIQSTFDESETLLNRKIAEYALAVVKDKPHFHVSLAIDISPYCDCHAENDAPIVPNVGMFASFDPVAIDAASADAINRQPVNPGTLLSEKAHDHDNYFADVFPNTVWHVQVEHGQKIGLGSMEYELVRI
ncbi:MAG: DUF362 domain-containing protein [Clostridia bacterium]|nr:DUF362 domain-containing protein [Clostridia bacterium]